MTDESGRYAIYFAPEAASPLARFGARWLGYDAAAGIDVAQPAVPGIAAERLAAITAEPRRYGFHATLKPPFALAERADADGLDRAAAALAATMPAFAAGRLRLACVAGFWALVPSAPCAALDELAARCVAGLDRFRAPPAEAELERRRRAGLSTAQDALLRRWGYPYVMAEFRFHMTLTARLAGDEGAAIGEVLAGMVTPFCREPLVIDAICLFRQPHREAPFCLLRRYELAD